MRTNDFEFSYIDKENKEQCDEIKQFIERHEWLGKLPIWLTHRFTARLKKNGDLAGVIVMATPNSFSNVLGKEKRKGYRKINKSRRVHILVAKKFSVVAINESN